MTGARYPDFFKLIFQSAFQNVIKLLLYIYEHYILNGEIGRFRQSPMLYTLTYLQVPGYNILKKFNRSIDVCINFVNKEFLKKVSFAKTLLIFQKFILERVVVSINLRRIYLFLTKCFFKKKKKIFICIYAHGR